jgi:hypothetical protein
VATRAKEVQAFLRLGRDSNWPLSVTVATAISPTTTLAVAYVIDWSGIQCTEEGEISVGWCWTKFNEKVVAENLACPPAFLRLGVNWEAIVRKENNSIRVVLKEAGIWTPEDPGGPPPMILFGPSAVIKVRTSLKGVQALAEMTAVLGILYQNRYTISEEIPSREWAIVGSFGGGEVPIRYRLPQPQMTHSEMIAANASIDRGRGTLIRSLASQGKLLQYWARTETNIEVGMFLPEESNGVPRNIEYWMNLTRQWIPNARPEQYPGILRDMCIQRTKMISNGVAEWLSGIEDFRVETRYKVVVRASMGPHAET